MQSVSRQSRVLALIALLPALAVAAPFRPRPKSAKPAASPILRYARYAVPPGWKETVLRGKKYPEIVLKNGLDVIRIRLFGGEKSIYPTPAQFLSGLDATNDDSGAPPVRLGAIAVSGQKAALYLRRYIYGMRFVKGGFNSRPPMAKEKFCLLPVSPDRFLVFSFARESQAVDLSGRGEKSWRQFLSSLHLKKTH